MSAAAASPDVVANSALPDTLAVPATSTAPASPAVNGSEVLSPESAKSEEPGHKVSTRRFFPIRISLVARIANVCLKR